MAAATEAKKLLQKTRRENGQCIQCGAPANGKSRCPEHAAKNQTSRQIKQETRKAAGLCIVCGEPAKEGCVMCQKHRDSGGLAYCPEHREKQAAIKHDWYEQRKADGLCTICGDPLPNRDSLTCEECRTHKNETAAERWARLKAAAFVAYGGPVCYGCGEDEPAILEIDHIDGGGTKHRIEIGQSNMYLWLKQNHYPEGYRVLCPTCNKKAHAKIPLPNEASP